MFYLPAPPLSALRRKHEGIYMTPTQTTTYIQSLLLRAAEHAKRPLSERELEYARFREQLLKLNLFASDYNKTIQKLKQAMNVQ